MVRELVGCSVLGGHLGEDYSLGIGEPKAYSDPLFCAGLGYPT